MKTGIAAKILSIALSLILLGSGFLHSLIHSFAQCSCENTQMVSGAGCPEKAQATILHKSHSSGVLQTIEVICPICAGLFTFVTPAESSGILRFSSVTAFLTVPDSPVTFSDCRLPQSRAPPQS